MFKIEAGVHTSTKSGISYKVLEEIKPRQIRHIWFVEGENGVGKTSFLEGVLIDNIKMHGTPFLFIGQDFHVQSIALRSSIAVLDFTGSKKSDYSLVEQVLGKIASKSILIFDEFDKRCTQDEFMSLICSEKASNVFLVSHRNKWIKENSKLQIFHAASSLFIKSQNGSKQKIVREIRIY